MEAKCSLSSQIATGIYWSPLSGLKGVKPPVEFGEGTRECSLGPARKEGPHLATTGESRSLLLAVARHVGFLSSYDRELREPLVLPQGRPVSIRVARGSATLLSSHGRGIVPQNALKGDSRGLSQIAAGNPGFPDL